MEKASVTIKIDTQNRQINKVFKTVFDAVEYLLIDCTPEERLNLFSGYCKWCGTDKLPCYCNRDD